MNIPTTELPSLPAATTRVVPKHQTSAAAHKVRKKGFATWVLWVSLPTSKPQGFIQGKRTKPGNAEISALLGWGTEAQRGLGACPQYCRAGRHRPAIPNAVFWHPSSRARHTPTWQHPRAALCSTAPKLCLRSEFLHPEDSHQQSEQ